MKKSEVIEFFGGTKETAHALNLTTNAVYMWPDELGDTTAGRIIGLAIQAKGLRETRKIWPAFFEQKTS